MATPLTVTPINGIETADNIIFIDANDFIFA